MFSKINPLLEPTQLFFKSTSFTLGGSLTLSLKNKLPYFKYYDLSSKISLSDCLMRLKEYKQILTKVL